MITLPSLYGGPAVRSAGPSKPSHHAFASPSSAASAQHAVTTRKEVVNLMPDAAPIAVTGFTDVLRRLIEGIRGEWTFSANGDDTLIRWIGVGAVASAGMRCRP